ncbi:MAG: hypothetical protein AAGF57_01835 [Pseudomonadota bacterium]
MTGRNHRRAADRHNRSLPCTPFLIVVLLSLPLFGQAQPKAIGPKDIALIQQQTEFTGDWSSTNRFNLDRYLTLRVTIHKLKIPERDGNVHLWFSLNNEARLAQNERIQTVVPIKATMQSKAVVERLGVRERDFPNGVQAVIRGWPAQRNNFSGSLFLIDEILIEGSGKRIALHADNPNMDENRSSEVTLE